MENSSNAGAGAQGGGNGSSGVPQQSVDSNPSQGAPSGSTNSPNSNAVPEDADWELSPGQKVKRSQFLKQHEAFKKGMYSSQERAASVTKKFDSLSGALQKYGITAEEFLKDPDAHMSRAAQDLIAKQVDESLMNPKDLELQNRERSLKDREDKIKAEDEKRSAAESEARVTAKVDEIAQSMAQALNASGLPANPKTVARVAEVMAQAYRQSKIKLTPEEAIPYAAKLIRQEQEWHLNQYQDPEALIKALGDTRLEMIRKHLVEQARARRNPQPRVQSTQPMTDQPRDERTKRYIGWEEYQRNK